MKALHFIAATIIAIPCAIGLGLAAGAASDQCHTVQFREGFNFDRYSPNYGTWSDDYGHVVGYSLQEDNEIVSEVTCLPEVTQ
jgi:hypothetical protein